MFRIAGQSLRHRAVVALLALALIGVGGLALTQLKREPAPSLEVPSAAVIATYPGQAPAVVLEQVTRPIELAIKSIPGLDQISSTAASGQSLTVASFTYGTDLAQVNQQLMTVLAQTNLPDGAETQFVSGSLNDLPVIQIAVTSLDAVTADPVEMDRIVREVLLPRLMEISQVRSADVSGSTQDVITITLDQAAMTRYEVSLAQIMAVLRDNGVTMPAGSVTEQGQTVSVQVGSTVKSVEDLGKIPLKFYQPPAEPAPAPSRGQTPTPAPPPPAELVTLEMVSELTEVAEPVRSYSRLDGQDAIAITITKTPQAGSAEVSAAVAKAVREANLTLAVSELSAQVIYDQAPAADRTVLSLAKEGAMALGACLVIILIFLLSVRSTVVTLISIPLSLLGALAVLYAGGGNLNSLSAGALVIAIGFLANDSIIVAENIKRHLGYGGERLAAVRAGVKEVAGAVTASTLSRVAVFLPVIVFPGLVRELFATFARTATIAWLCSLLVVLTVVPVLSYWFAKRPVILDAADAERQRHDAEAREEKQIGGRTYLGLSRPLLKHPVLVILAALVVLAATVWFGRSTTTGFLAETERNTLQVVVTFPPNTSLTSQNEAAQEVEEILSTLPFTQTVLATVGQPTGFQTIASAGQPAAHFTVTVEEAHAAGTADRIRQALTGFSGGQVSLPPGDALIGSATIDLVVMAIDSESLAAATKQVGEAIGQLSRIKAITDNLATGQDVYEIVIDRVKATSLGMTETQIANLVVSLVYPAAIGQVVDGTATVDVQLSLGQAAATTEDLLRLPLGNGVVLGDVAEIKLVSTPAVITTTNLARSATISITPDDTDLGRLAQTIQQTVSNLSLPQGINIKVGGLASLQADSFRQLGWAMLAGIVLVCILMAAVLRSLLQPLVLLLVAVPFAVPGVWGVLKITGTTLGLAQLTGLLLLIAVTCSNAVILVALINRYRSDGRHNLQQAIEDGLRRRFKPVAVSALAMVAALAPLALGLGGQPAFISSNLALTLIGGLVSSTLLSLLVVPAVYQLEARGHERREAKANRREAERRRRRADQLGLPMAEWELEAPMGEPVTASSASSSDEFVPAPVVGGANTWDTFVLGKDFRGKEAEPAAESSELSATGRPLPPRPGDVASNVVTEKEPVVPDNVVTPGEDGVVPPLFGPAPPAAPAPESAPAAQEDSAPMRTIWPGSEPPAPKLDHRAMWFASGELVPATPSPGRRPHGLTPTERAALAASPAAIPRGAGLGPAGYLPAAGGYTADPRGGWPAQGVGQQGGQGPAMAPASIWAPAGNQPVVPASVWAAGGNQPAPPASIWAAGNNQPAQPASAWAGVNQPASPAARPAYVTRPAPAAGSTGLPIPPGGSAGYLQGMGLAEAQLQALLEYARRQGAAEAQAQANRTSPLDGRNPGRPPFPAQTDRLNPQLVSR